MVDTGLVYGPPRILEGGDNLYMIRDVFYEDGRPVGHCEYAHGLSENVGQIVWSQCREGVLFTEIEPFLPRDSLRV